MDVGILLNCLSKINKDNIRATYHFQERINQRKSEVHPDLNEIYNIILKEQPVGILKQEEGKFKLYYERTELILNLVTCFLEEAKKRRRLDEAGISGN